MSRHAFKKQKRAQNGKKKFDAELIQCKNLLSFYGWSLGFMVGGKFFKQE